jgi:hypothetical protein
VIDGARRHALALVVLLGMALRIYPWLLPHAFLGVLEHDDGIYYGGAKLLLHGRLPYADVTVVHPPGASVLLLPFAWLGDVIGDPWGLGAARLAMVVVAAANVVLVHRLALRLPGGTQTRALVAAALYAVIPTAVVAEHTVLLEPLVTLPCLLAVLLLSSQRGGERRVLIVAGLLLALAVSTKLFGAAYVLVLTAWLLLARRPRDLSWLAAGLAAGASALLLPFFVVAPQAFWQDVVVTQLSRPADSGSGRLERVVDMVGLGLGPAIGAVLLVWAVLEVALRVRRAGHPAYVVWVGVVIVGGVSFVGAASYFPHYGAFLAPPVALLVSRGSKPLVVALLVAFVAGSVADDAQAREQGDWAQLARQVPKGSCVFYESASVPIALDRFELPSPVCPAWLDARGLLYSESTDWPKDRDFYYEGFITNRAWQRGVQDQLRHADRLLLKGSPEQIPEWASDTRAYAVAHFRRVAAVDGRGKAHVEVWARVVPG